MSTVINSALFSFVTWLKTPKQMETEKMKETEATKGRGMDTLKEQTQTKKREAEEEVSGGA